MSKISYTLTDEAPYLATASFHPILTRFLSTTFPGGVQLCDIGIAARVIATFSDLLPPSQRLPDELSELGKLAKTPEANIIKLPNVSASVPQLKSVIFELQSKGIEVPDYPENPTTLQELAVFKRYSSVLGSAVNPVLREGNSDRRAAAPVKRYAQAHPHRLSEWDTRASKTRVVSMESGDFYGSELSVVIERATNVRIELISSSDKATDNAATIVLKDSIPVLANEVLDSAYLSCSSLCSFFAAQLSFAKRSHLLFSLHLKATMMKVSDPIIFGHCVKVFFKDVFSKHSRLFGELGVNPNLGVSDLLNKVSSLPDKKLSSSIKRDIDRCYSSSCNPHLAMVNCDKGITNLHVPSDVIVDASMPVVIRDGGKMWNARNSLVDTLAVIPDRSYSGIYQETVEDCQRNGRFDVRTMGHVSNVGLMAKKAEEYGSHNNTFKVPNAGTVRVVDCNSGEVLMQHDAVGEGDVWRMCQAKDVAIRDWVRLAVERAR